MSENQLLVAAAQASSIFLDHQAKAGTAGDET
jgi:hypothetical protein